MVRYWTVKAQVGDRDAVGLTTGLTVQAISRDSAISGARAYYRAKGVFIKRVVSARLTF